jgi:hypothetical protein
MTRPELLVMAAGMGSRFRGPKQVEPVGPCGETVLDYSVFDAMRAGVERVVFVIRKDMEADFHGLVGARLAKRLDVAYAFQDAAALPKGMPPPEGRLKPWGTGHAALSAMGVVKGPFIAINADDFYGRRAYALLADWLGAQHAGAPAETPAETPKAVKATKAMGGPAHYALVAFRMANTLSPFGPVARGVCEVGGDGALRSVREFTGLVALGGGVRNTAQDGTVTEFTGAEPVSMNFWGFAPSVFGALEEMFADFLLKASKETAGTTGIGAEREFYLPGAIDGMVRAGAARVHVLETPDRWFGVTYREDREHAVQRVGEMIALGEYPHSLWGAP